MSAFPRDEVAPAFLFSVIPLAHFSAAFGLLLLYLLEAPCGLGCVEGPTGHSQCHRFAGNNPRITVKR